MVPLAWLGTSGPTGPPHLFQFQSPVGDRDNHNRLYVENNRRQSYFKLTENTTSSA